MSDLTSILDILPSNLTCKTSSIYARMKAPGISTVATSHSSIASIVADNMTDSIATVGEDASSLLVVSYRFLPSAHLRPLILPHHFFGMNIR
jgi:hypothetical protein